MLEEKIRIIYNLIDIHDNGLILRTEFDKFFTISCVQSSDSLLTIGMISERLFENALSITLDSAFRSTLKSESLRKFFTETLNDLFHLK